MIDPIQVLTQAATDLVALRDRVQLEVARSAANNDLAERHAAMFEMTLEALRKRSAELDAREALLLAAEERLRQGEHATLAAVRERMLTKMQKGTTCPCCGQHVKVYRRKLNASMASALITFHRVVSGDTERWVHVPSETRLSPLGGDWARLAHWGLIETKLDVEREDNGPNSGFWRITVRGVSFVMGALNVPAHINIFNGELVPADEGAETVSVREALGKEFDYDELMKTPGAALPAMGGDHVTETSLEEVMS